TRRQRRQRRIKQFVVLVFLFFVGFVVWSYLTGGDPGGDIRNDMVIGPNTATEGQAPGGGDGGAEVGIVRRGSDGVGVVGDDSEPVNELVEAIQDPPPQPLPPPDPTPALTLDPTPEPMPEKSPPVAVIEVAKPLTPVDGNTVTIPTASPYGAQQSEGLRLAIAAEQMVLNGQLVEARDMLNRALLEEPGSPHAADWREQLGQINQTLIFSPSLKYIEEDPLVEAYAVKPGEVLGSIAKRYGVPYEFIMHMNNITDARRLRAGQRIKVVKGPFRAMVHKLDYRLDVFLGDVFIRTFRVGLGEHDSTPPGAYEVRSGSKLENPEWVNPRTGERFLADDPENPLGEYWIGLKGIDEDTQFNKGYGIHGTIYPETIGTQASMGCVRMLASDIELVYAMLSEGSLVDIID
ncbi:MAG: L,D-transpeptidase family protein, partial [Planctomycetota bacterium]